MYGLEEETELVGTEQEEALARGCQLDHQVEGDKLRETTMPDKGTPSLSAPPINAGIPIPRKQPNQARRHPRPQTPTPLLRFSPRHDHESAGLWGGPEDARV